MMNSTPNKQSGVTLVVSLIILVSLTILGVTSMLSSRTEVSMAGNMRKAGIAFNAAEVGLRAGEAYVNASTTTTIYADTTELGLYNEDEPSPPYGDITVWADSREATTNLPIPGVVAAQPKFIIHYLGERSQNEVAAVNIGGYGSGQPGMTVANFKITARGVGQSINEVRYVQSHMGHEY